MRAQANIRHTLGWASFAALTGLLLLLNVIALRHVWSGGPYRPSSISHSMPEEDFANLWAAGHMARQGHEAGIFGATTFQAWRQAAFGADVVEQDWVYPPTVLLLGVPLSCLPLLPAFLLWDAATLLIGILLLRGARLPWPVIIGGLAAPACWRSLVLGQYGIIMGALVVAGLLHVPRRPLRAGIMLGLATLKPQQGAIAVFAFLAARSWRAIATGAAMVACLAVAVLLSFGPGVWWLFFTKSALLARQLLDAPLPQPYINDGVSVFWMARSFGAGVGVSYAVQGFSALSAISLTWLAWRKPDAAITPRMALTVSLSLLTIPYGFTSDMVAVSIAQVALVAARGWRLSPFAVIVWLWPAFCSLLTFYTGGLLTPAIVALLAFQAWRQLTPAPHSPAPPGPSPAELSRGSKS